jgi:DNA-binding transcriptional LysR family regulator
MYVEVEDRAFKLTMRGWLFSLANLFIIIVLTGPFVIFELLLPLVADFSKSCPGYRISDFGVRLMLLLDVECYFGIRYTKQSSLAMSQLDSK